MGKKEVYVAFAPENFVRLQNIALEFPKKNRYGI
jgi:hypothetical protein